MIPLNVLRTQDTYILLFHKLKDAIFVYETCISYQYCYMENKFLADLQNQRQGGSRRECIWVNNALIWSFTMLLKQVSIFGHVLLKGEGAE